MTKEEILDQSEKACKCAEEMRLLASQYKQMGFKELTRYLNKEADRALLWQASLLVTDK